MDQPGVPGHDSEAAAMVDVKVREVKGQNIKQTTVDYHQLVVIAHQIVSGPRNGASQCEQTHLELAQVNLAAPVGVSNQRTHRNAAADRSLQLRLNFGSVETEDHDLDAFLGVSDSRKQRRDSVVRLDQEFHRQRV